MDEPPESPGSAHTFVVVRPYALPRLSSTVAFLATTVPQCPCAVDPAVHGGAGPGAVPGCDEAPVAGEAGGRAGPVTHGARRA